MKLSHTDEETESHKGYHGLSSTNNSFLCHMSLSSTNLCTNGKDNDDSTATVPSINDKAAACSRE